MKSGQWIVMISYSGEVLPVGIWTYDFSFSKILLTAISL